MRLASSTRTRIAATAALAVIGLTGACSSDGGTVPPPPAPGGQQNTQSFLDRAPVATPDELAKSPTATAIKQRGELLIGGSLDAPLLSQQNPTTGETEGFDAMLGKLLAKYIIGAPSAKIVNSGSETREALLQNSTVDVVFQTYTITPERAQKVAFAGPYLISGQAIAVLKGKNGITKPSDLNGKKVIAGANTPGIDAIKQQAPQADIVAFGTDPECVQALEQGRGDAYVQDLTLLAASARLNDKIEIRGEPFTSDPYGIGLKHGDDSFKQFVNQWLTKIQGAGLWQQAWKDSLGSVVAGEAPNPPAIGSVPGS
ncbi:glutamate ABC transporter substrate-binding protein [Amycolatopsis suaedae]|uniref:Glutamate ABC transporter substrate-binding protein n=1 Tax=Amycolatopsis suaedae TaxID=2510978 RepID=A0A4Q7J4R0_9PSEU|nr:glutamate ABC transporter substrate-binding protein [Amycolatopsis suaedae]RZQ61798.1 glutamate ABC transporter substrate-binding protein [Amycolatopsis suaedae]